MLKWLINSSLRFMNMLYVEAAGGDDRPAFMNVGATYPALSLLDEHFGTIRDELSDLLRAPPHIPQYFQIDKRQSYISTSRDQSKKWRVFLLYAMGEKPAANRKRCPRTSELLDRVPGLFQAFFSILDAGKFIPPHRGPFLGYIRYHLALLVPEHEPPQIRVKDQVHTWQEGESILFDDTLEHEVMNASDSQRVVLIVDVLRPLPPMLHGMNVAFKWAARFVYGRRMIRNMQEFDANVEAHG